MPSCLAVGALHCYMENPYPPLVSRTTQPAPAQPSLRTLMAVSLACLNRPRASVLIVLLQPFPETSVLFSTPLLLCCQTRPTFLAPHRTEVVHCMRKLPLPIVKLTRVPSSRLRPEGQDDEGTVHGIRGSS